MDLGADDAVGGEELFLQLLMIIAPPLLERFGVLDVHGLDGVVCSPQEVTALRAATGAEFRLVTPGIRLGEARVDDQTRIATPENAIRSGADYIVIGRPITQAPDAREALRAIRSRIGETV